MQGQQAGEAPPERDDIFRAIAEQTTDLIALTDAQGVITRVSSASTSFFQRAPEEMCGHHFTEFLDESAVPTVLAAFRDGFEGDKPVRNLELRMKRKDGSTFFGVLNGSRLQVDGQQTALVVIRDITEHRQREEALRISEDRYKILIDLSPDAVVVQVGGKYVFANQAAARLFGAASPRELVGTDMLERVHPDYRELVAQRAAQVQAGIATRPQEMKLLRLDGTAVEVEAAAAKIEFDGMPANQVVYRDITERKQAEELLQDEISRRRILVGQSTDGIVVLDQWGKVYEANQQYARMLGYSLEEVYELHVWDWDTQFPKEQLLEMLGAVDDKGAHFETHHRRKDGTLREVEISTNGAIYGGKKYIFCVCRDMTERKRAEELLRLTQFAVDHAVDSVYWTDASGRLIYVNDATCKRHRYSQDEMLAMNLLALDPSLSREQWALNWEVIKERGRIELETMHQTKDGEMFPVEVRANYVQYEDKEYNCVISRDITERKRAEEAVRESEERYQQLVESANDWVWQVDEQGRYVFASPKVVELLGYEPEEMLGKTPFDLMPPDEAERVAVLFASIVAERRSFRDLENVNRHKDGRLVFLETSGTPIIDSTGEYRGYRGMDRDVTERKQAEEALRQAEEQLRQAQKMEAVGQLAGGIAHDFNNLLAAILGYADLLLGNPELSGPLARGDVQEIKHAAERAAALTKQILAFSRRQVLMPTVVSLNDVLGNMESLLRRTLGEDVELLSLKDPDLGKVEVDVHQFEQVIMNLALNARDAMASGGRLTLETANARLGAVYCRTHPEVRPGAYVMLRISDDGVGMDEAVLAHIFEPFFTTKEPGRGTGLGLALVYGVVQQSQGSIVAESQPGRGATFTIYLPQVREAAPAKSPPAPGVGAAPGRETILLVEDEVSLQKLVARVLGHLGYRVLVAGTAARALEVAGQADGPPDLLLTDVVLPGEMQGPDLARELLSQRPQLPVLFMSGYPRQTIGRAGRLDEGVNLLEKPFTGETLAAAVRLVLNQARARA
jgi:two-component system, cell cycle sensor histidine kinase and response regulator CckA